MSNTFPSDVSDKEVPKGKPKTKRWIALSIVGALLLGAAIATPILLIQSGVWGGSKDVIHASSEGIDVSVKPVGTADTRYQAAVTASEHVLVGEYLMLTPVEISTESSLPASGVQLQLELPAKLPEDVRGTFSYFDEEFDVWVPVETELQGKTATATVDHLSLWSFVVTDPGLVVIDLSEVADTLANGAKDAMEWWAGTDAGKWIYRNAGLFFGHQAAIPECGAGETPEWLEHSLIFRNPNLADSAQPLLICTGVDPSVSDDVVQVKAASNRAYGHLYALAEGVKASDLSSTFLADLGLTDFYSVSEQIGLIPFIDLHNFIPGSEEITFSVSQDDVLAAMAAGQNIIEFKKPDPGRLAASILLSTIMDYAFDSAEITLFAASALFKDCALTDIPEEAGAIAAAVKDCAEHAEEPIDLLEKLSTTDGVPNTPFAEKVLSSKAAKHIGAAMKKLKWLAVVDIGLELIDYFGENSFQESGYPMHYVAMEAKEKIPSWEDINGYWCGGSRMPDCITIDVPVTINDNDLRQGVTKESRLTLMREEGGCFVGDWVPYPVVGGRGGSYLVYCPPGAPGSADWFRYETPGGTEAIGGERMYLLGSSEHAFEVFFRAD